MSKFTKREIVMHNSYHGQAARMAIGAQAVINSRTATVEAKLIADEILHLAKELRVALKKRVDQ